MKEAKDFADRPAVNEGGQHTPDWPHSTAAHVLRRTGRTLAVSAAAVCCCCFSTVASCKEVPLCVSMDLAVLLLLLLHAHVQQTRFSQDWRQPLTGKPHSLSFSLPARNGWDKEWSLRFHSFIIFFCRFLLLPRFPCRQYLFLSLSLFIYIHMVSRRWLFTLTMCFFFFRRSFVPLFFLCVSSPFFFFGMMAIRIKVGVCCVFLIHWYPLPSPPPSIHSDQARALVISSFALLFYLFVLGKKNIRENHFNAPNAIELVFFFVQKALLFF